MTNKRILTLITLLLFLLLVVGCDVIKPNQAPEITSYPVTKATVGVEYVYDVEATDPDAEDVLTYTLTTEPSGMLIDPDNGLITWTPDTAGDFDVTVDVSDGALSDTQSFTITVIEPVPDPVIELTGIVINPKTMTLMVGKSEAIKSVTATYEIRGTEVPIAIGDCTYESDDEDVATVSDAGLVTAVAEGIATITVSYGGKSDTIAVTVNEFALELVGIVVDPEEMTLCVPMPKGLTGTFTVTADYNDDTEKVVTSDCVYGISDISIVTVDKEVSEVTALKVGTVNITISYTEEGITKGTTLNVIVEGTITIHWLESAVRYNADDSVHSSWPDEIVPPPAPHWGPAELILTGGEYHFADVKDFYNVHLTPEMGLEGSVVIDETGLLSGHTTYTLHGLDTTNDFLGQVKIIIGEEVENTIVPDDPFTTGHDGIMVGTYTQWKYAYAESDEELELLNGAYPAVVLAPEQGSDWWFVQYTIYTAHGVVPPG